MDRVGYRSSSSSGNQSDCASSNPRVANEEFRFEVSLRGSTVHLFFPASPLLLQFGQAGSPGQDQFCNKYRTLDNMPATLWGEYDGKTKTLIHGVRAGVGKAICGVPREMRHVRSENCIFARIRVVPIPSSQRRDNDECWSMWPYRRSW